jgi:hypothetical protein
MKTSRGRLSVIALAALAAFVACVGDDPATSGVQPDPNAKPGEFRGRCDSGRCLTGLRCDAAIDICVRDEDASAGDSGADECAFKAPSAEGIPCVGSDPATCTGNEYCCLDTAANDCNVACSQKEIRCDGAEECPGEKCCMRTEASFKPNACQSTVTGEELIGILCEVSCDDAYRICRTDAECDLPKKCRKLAVKTQQGDIPLGFCQ